MKTLCSCVIVLLAAMANPARSQCIVWADWTTHDSEAGRVLGVCAGGRGTTFCFRRGAPAAARPARELDGRQEH